ncbi:inverted formin-2 [Herpailurus yagouaroundi]|uniref:inverted formin-2 n=1 Tax=Herpailurus yagouaroundi TaxID=1608482 RepID=UPI001AD75776|nr:inverted formin-2-like [Puma yagouaroundi]
MEPPPTRRRLAPGDGFVRRPEPRRQAQPPPPPRGAPALASQNWVPVWSGPSACLHPEPRDGGHSSLLPPLVPEPFASSGGPRPPSAFPEPGPGAARGHRPREVEALRAYLSPVLLRRGVWRRHRWAALAVLSPPPPPLPLAAAAAAAAAAVGVSGAAAAAAAGLFLSGYVKVT